MKLRENGISSTLAVVVVIAVLVVAAGAYFLFSSSSSSGTSKSISSSRGSSTVSTSSASLTSSSSTSMTPISTSSATTTSATTQTSTCYSVTASTNSTTGQELVGFFRAYSSMSFGFQGTKNGKQADLNMSYSVEYETSTTYKVSINATINGKVKLGTIWIFKNGTILAGELNGKNYTGSTVNNYVLGAFEDLDTVYTLALQATTMTSYFHSVGTSTATIGTNSFTVTDYVANTTPETIQVCNEQPAVIDVYNVHAGTPSGSSLEMITSADFSGTLTTPTGYNTLDYTYQLTALTVS